MFTSLDLKIGSYTQKSASGFKFVCSQSVSAPVIVSQFSICVRCTFELKSEVAMRSRPCDITTRPFSARNSSCKEVLITEMRPLYLIASCTSTVFIDSLYATGYLEHDGQVIQVTNGFPIVFIKIDFVYLFLIPVR